MNCIIFFKNPVGELRANAATVAGYLIFNLTEEQINGLSKEHILNGEYLSFSLLLIFSFFSRSIYRSIKRSQSGCSLSCG
jgi:hypothetical protein